MSFSPDIDKFIRHLSKNTTLAERSLRHYEEQCTCVFKILEIRRPDIQPKDVRKSDTLWLLGEMESRKYTIQTRKGYIQALRKITEYYNNHTVRKMQIRWPHDNRPNVDWLDIHQAQKLLDHPKSPNQELIVHCELCLGMRRSEVARLKPDDFNGAFVSILGKGSMGGKPRLVPYHPNTDEVLARYISYRNALIALAKSRYPSSTVVPEILLIWERGAKLHTYSSKRLSGFDGQLKALSKEVGFHFSSHTLRRTFGRLMYRSGVPVATISKLLGHEDTSTTLLYIGVDFDDMSSAMTIYQLRCRI